MAYSPNNMASRFLNSISTSCRPVGHSNEAAKYARRQFFLLWVRFGAPSLFYTITPDDEFHLDSQLKSSSDEDDRHKNDGENDMNGKSRTKKNHITSL